MLDCTNAVFKKI